MKVNSINNFVCFSRVPSVKFTGRKHSAYCNEENTPDVQTNEPAFKGGGDFSKKSWFIFRKLSDYMKNPSEMTSALIAFIGTGAIAPFAIMCSPVKKKSASEEDKAEAREKKFFQALRQPVSAALAFGFQVPTTIGIKKGLNYLAYKKHHQMFNDDILGTLIPDKKYLQKQAMKALKSNPSEDVLNEWKEELKKVQDETKIKEELKAYIRDKEYGEVGRSISEEKLNKMAENKNRLKKFKAEKMASAKHDSLFNAKLKELDMKRFDNIQAQDLVTEGYQDLARLRFKDEFKALKENAKLSSFDNFVKIIGASNKKLASYEKAEKDLAKKRGLELLKEGQPELFTNDAEKFKNFMENKNVAAQKMLGKKIFWITLVTNLFMVAASCIALNWLHPKFADFVDNIRAKRKAKKEADNKKVEVSS